MKRVPLKTLIDFSDDGEHDDGTPIMQKLIDPFLAIQWVATGEFAEPDGPREWWRCLEDEVLLDHSREEGRRELAEEIVIGAIGSGVLRCAFVVDSTKPRDPWERKVTSRHLADTPFRGRSTALTVVKRRYKCLICGTSVTQSGPTARYRPSRIHHPTSH